MPSLRDIRTPALVLERGILTRNIAVMAARMQPHGVALRPHLKTAKCAQVAKLATAGQFGGITVSTLAEAAYFAGHGFRDITYAVGIVPAKLGAVAELQRDGTIVRLLTDDVTVAEALAVRATALGTTFHVCVEIDTGGQRGGGAPESDALLGIARRVHESPALCLDGVLTHAGQSYATPGAEAARAVAATERAGVVRAAERLRAAGLPCPVVSAGSTPTAVHATSLAGVTEMRPGNFMFFDLTQVGLGSCTVNDVAVSVLASVIGHTSDGNRALVDAGSLALSADTSANAHLPGVGFGIVGDLWGRPLDGAAAFPLASPRTAPPAASPAPGYLAARIARVHQEHGFIESMTPLPLDALPVGTRVRILPNHACITAAMYDAYHVVDGSDEIVALWPRARGW
jgi:D-serine deaminase-like pyridoxal phosphate-dependent protein